MYRRPILCTFIRRCWFLKCSEEIHYVPIGAGDMWYYVPVDDGWEEVLYTLRPSTSLQMPNIELYHKLEEHLRIFSVFLGTTKRKLIPVAKVINIL
jgi:hypothetical protein